MARYGPPDDPDERPTRKVNYGAAGPWPPPGPYGSADLPGTPTQAASGQPVEPPPAPTPWYRRRAVLVGWGLLVLILVALIIYGLIELGTRGGGGPSPTHTTTTTPSTSTTTTAPTTTSTTPSTTTTEPSSSAPTEAPAPPPAAPPPAPAPPVEPTHRRPHLPKLPPTITVPGGPTLTLPPGF